MAASTLDTDFIDTYQKEERKPVEQSGVPLGSTSGGQASKGNRSESGKWKEETKQLTD